MNIHIILPNKKSLESAGVRIRYQRIQKMLPKPFALELVIMDEMNDINEFRADCIIFCKCYNTKSIAIAHQLKALGKYVAIDVFDDYFSKDKNTPELAPIRTWFKQILPLCDFVLCSTTKIQSKLKESFLVRKSHVLNDPYQTVDFKLTPGLIEQKISKTKTTKTIKVLWFGIGDNPYFSLGLDDLYHYLDFLHPTNHTYKIHLTILTNQRALTLENLQKIQKSSIAFEIHEWSESLEKKYLKESLVSFLPVNHQPFSQAKSLNRAITTLCLGNQVLSCGYPLYRQLNDYIYHQIDDIITDLDNNELKLTEKHYPLLNKLFEEFANPKNEAKKFANFLSTLSTEKMPHQAPVIVIRGIKPHFISDDLFKNPNIFSASLPFSRSQKYNDFHLNYNKIKRQWCLVLSPKATTYVAQSNNQKKLSNIDWQTLISEHLIQLPRFEVGKTTFNKISLYQPFIKCLKGCLTTLLPEAKLVSSESCNILPEYCFEE